MLALFGKGYAFKQAGTVRGLMQNVLAGSFHRNRLKKGARQIPHLGKEEAPLKLRS
jgi:hypothetical protein